MNDQVPVRPDPTEYGFGDTISLGARMAMLDDEAIAAATSSRMGLLWPILLGVVGGAASPGLVNPLAWLGYALVGAVGFFLLCGYCHLVSQLFGGHGNFDDLIKGAGTASLVRIASVIPILGWFASVWYSVILVKVLMRVYGHGMGTAIAIIALPLVLILLGSILLFFGVAAMGIFGAM